MLYSGYESSKKESMKPQSAKAKGRNFEKALVEILYEEFPELEEGDIEWRSMGAAGIDLMLSPKARKVFPVSIEAKSTKIKPGPAAMEQAKANIYDNTVAVVAWKPPRKNIKEGVAMLDFRDLARLIKLVRNQ